MDYAILLSDNSRADDYVNATKLCAAFGKNVNEWKRESGKAVIEAATSKYGVNTIVSKGGRYGGTLVHPLLTIELASYLSVDLHIVMLEVLNAHIQGDTIHD